MEGEAHSVTIGNVPSLERFQAIPNGKSRLNRRALFVVCDEPSAEAENASCYHEVREAGDGRFVVTVEHQHGPAAQTRLPKQPT